MTNFLREAGTRQKRTDQRARPFPPLKPRDQHRNDDAGVAIGNGEILNSWTAWRIRGSLESGRAEPVERDVLVNFTKAELLLGSSDGQKRDRRNPADLTRVSVVALSWRRR